ELREGEEEGEPCGQARTEQPAQGAQGEQPEQAAQEEQAAQREQGEQKKDKKDEGGNKQTGTETPFEFEANIAAEIAREPEQIEQIEKSEKIEKPKNLFEEELYGRFFPY
ncbi:MAG: hypothetical protein LBD13_06685, partial [Spirochaetaceae bacterium]|nr:hypothetical protein [Spirochaetaceae bacterium]